MNKKNITVTKSKKILEVLTDAGFSYANANKILRGKDVKLNGVRIKENLKAEVGDEIEIFYKDEPKTMQIVFQDDEILIINKFTGVEVDEEFAKSFGCYAVHRLDRNTEGLLILAKTMAAKNKLDKAIKQHKISKFYLAEVVGKFDKDGKYEAYLTKDSEKSLVKVTKNKVENSQKIETYVKALKVGQESSLVEVEIEGGKTHQIRAHLAFLGHAIVGDGKYSRREDYKKFGVKYQKLFAYKLKFGKVGLKVDGRTFEIFPNWIDESYMKKLLKDK